MKTVLITGPIGSGKSEVRRRLEAKGFPVYDCDSRCKWLYETVPGLKSRIEASLGVRFSELALIFEDSGKLEKLEGIVLPLILRDIAVWKSSLASDVCFIESATASGKAAFDGAYDEIWLVDAPFPVRRLRNTDAALRDRLQSFDRSRARVIIENSSSLDDLYDKVDSAIAGLTV